MAVVILWRWCLSCDREVVRAGDERCECGAHAPPPLRPLRRRVAA